MGIDWVPARPRAGVNLDELRASAAAQALLVRHQLGDPASSADPPLRAGPVDDLADRFDIPVAADGSWPCYRVAAIGTTALFPPEWRRDAYATLLPADAAAAVARWRWWYDAVRAGGMRHYLRRVATWEGGLDTRAAQAELRRLAAEARVGRPPSDRLDAALAGVDALPDAPVVPPPGPSPATPAADAPHPDQEAIASALAGHTVRVDAAVRTYNRAVPSRLRAPYAGRPADPGAPPTVHRGLLRLGRPVPGRRLRGSSSGTERTGAFNDRCACIVVATQNAREPRGDAS